MAGPSGARTKDAPPREFFIVGCPRSGTSLLRFMLDAHPSIAVTPETHFGERHLSDSRSAAVGAFCASDAFLRMQIDEDRFRRAVNEAPQTPHLREDPWRPLRIALHEFARCRGVDIVGEKTPSHALHLNALSSAFPRARFLLVLRDPRAVAASWLQTSWSKQTPIEVAEKWRRHSRAMRQARDSLGDRCLEVRYEELVEDPEAVLGSICSLLGVEFDSRMLRFHDRRRDDPDARLPPDEGRDNSRLYGPVDPTRMGAWRHELGPRDRCRIESACGRTMIEMGYRPETPFLGRLAESLLIAPRLLRRGLRRRLRELRLSPIAPVDPI